MYDASQKTEIRDKSFDILFQRTPIAIVGTEKILGINLALNRLEGKNLFSFQFRNYIYFFSLKNYNYNL